MISELIESIASSKVLHIFLAKVTEDVNLLSLMSASFSKNISSFCRSFNAYTRSVSSTENSFTKDAVNLANGYCDSFPRYLSRPNLSFASRILLRIGPVPSILFISFNIAVRPSFFDKAIRMCAIEGCPFNSLLKRDATSVLSFLKTFPCSGKS